MTGLSGDISEDIWFRGHAQQCVHDWHWAANLSERYRKVEGWCTAVTQAYYNSNGSWYFHFCVQSKYRCIWFIHPRFIPHQWNSPLEVFVFIIKIWDVKRRDKMVNMLDIPRECSNKSCTQILYSYTLDSTKGLFGLMGEVGPCLSFRDICLNSLSW